MTHLLLFYRILFYSFGFSILAFAVYRFINSRNSIIGAFIFLWISMTLTAASYVLDYYMIINFQINGRSMAYTLMLFSVLLTGISIPFFTHTVFHIKRKYILVTSTVLSFCLSLLLFLPFPQVHQWLKSDLCMLFIILSNMYSFIVCLVYVLRLKERKNRLTGLLFLAGFLCFFVILYFVDIHNKEAKSGFLFFPVFYMAIGLFCLVMDFRVLRRKDRNISVPASFKERFKLTNREGEVVSLLINGLTYKKIAEKLFISTNTVSTHILHIYDKTKTNSKIDLIKKINDSE